MSERIFKWPSKRTRIKRLRTVAAFIESLPKRKFDIGDWGSSKSRKDLLDGPRVNANERIPDDKNRFTLTIKEVKKLGKDANGDWSLVCNTRFCIAGWVCFLFPKLIDPYEDIEGNARRILGLQEEEALELFYPNITVPNSTPKQAANAILALANTKPNIKGTFGELER